MGHRQQALDLLEVGDAERGVAGLAGAEQLAAAAQPQVLLGEAEAVLGLAHQREALAAHVGEAFADTPAFDGICQQVLGMTSVEFLEQWASYVRAGG